MPETILHSSLHRAFPGHCPAPDFHRLSGFQNEPLSFQLSFRLKEGRTQAVYPRIECALPLQLYLVGHVPVLHTDVGLEGVPAPGLIGDMLLPKQVNPPLEYKGSPWGMRYFEKGEQHTLNAASDCWQTLWLTVSEDGTPVSPGVYPVRIAMHHAHTGEKLSEDVLEITIHPALLPKQKLIYTNWFHCDCLADFYGAEIFSDRFFEIMRSQVRAAARNGMNMILTPFFTPPLDTPEGDERMTAQLVKVTVRDGAYDFDFSLLRRFLHLCLEEGIEYFEHSHLFSQWGAAAAPKVMAFVNGQEQRLFGWETPSDSSAYVSFLRAYLPAVKAFLSGEGLLDKTLFHISDEPVEETAHTFRRAAAAIGGLLDGCLCGDALSEYGFYEEGLVKTPIVKTDCIEPFLGRCEHLWAYYTGGQIFDGLSNRILVIPPERNRVLGLQLYRHRIEGFLHWGYNYYYDLLSQGLFDPKTHPCGYNNHPGAPFIVYPGRNGEAIQSARQKVFAECLLDLRALELLESLRGREACEALLREHFGEVTFRTVPDSPEHLLAFREALNKAAAEAL